MQAFHVSDARDPDLHDCVVRLCVQAKALLERRGLAYEEIPLDDDPAFRQTVFDLGGRWTVPLVLIEGEPVGG